MERDEQTISNEVDIAQDNSDSIPEQTLHQAPSPNSRPIRSSARVRAAKEKGKDKDSFPEPAASTSRKNTRTTHALPDPATQDASSSAAPDKGKQKESAESTRPIKRPRRAGTAVTSSGIVINEPIRDPKGKKRAAPESESEDDKPSPPKKSKTTAASTANASSSSAPYALRPRKSITTAANSSSKSSIMARKTKVTSAKNKAIAAKAKAGSVAGPSSHPIHDGDVEMSDPGMESGGEPDVTQEDKNLGAEPTCHHDDDHDEDDDDGDDDGDETMGDHIPPPGDGSGAPNSASMPLGGGLGGLDEGTAAALFGADYRALGSYMLTLSSRLKTILQNIKQKSDPTTRLLSLQELSELLSISTEDTLSGYFQIDAFVKELVKIMGGTGNVDDDDGDDGDDEPDQQDEDAALAAALAMSAGGMMPGDDNVEAQVLACRCLANLMEALPGCAHTVVYHGAVPVLCSKLIEIQYIDLAEQTLSTLEKISEEYPSAIVREGGLSALLNYLDFFSTNVQRTALQAASNCCRNASVDNFAQIRQVFPTIRNVLGYSDQRLVEYACLCVIRTVESFYRSSPDLLDTIMDLEMIKAVNVLLMPAGGSPLVSPTTYAALLHVLATSAKASPKVTLALLDADVLSTLYQILTGVLPPTSDDGCEQGMGRAGQGLGGGLADMAVMQTLAHRPKDQVEEALSLISELMPPLPKDGVFDHRAYSERGLAKLIKARAKAERAAARAATSSANPSTSSAATPSTASIADDPMSEAVSVAGQGDVTPPLEMKLTSPHDSDAPPPEVTAAPSTSEDAPPEPPAPTRIELLRSKPDLVQKFMRHIVPILLDVYAASVALPVRSRALTGLLKAISFMESDELKSLLKNVPMASFIGSILSSHDNSTLAIAAMQLVELLLAKLPSQYRASFRREGVLHEIETRAAQELVSPKPPKSVASSSTNDAAPPPPVVTELPTMPSEPMLAEPLAPPPVPMLSESPSGGPVPLPDAPILSTIVFPPIAKRVSSSTTDPQDLVILRARMIKFKFLSSPTGTGSQEAGDDLFETMQDLGRRLALAQATESETRRTLAEIATLFTKTDDSESVSSFELMQSGLVDGLLAFSTERGRKLDITLRQKLLLETFTAQSSTGTTTPSSYSPLAIFVKRLQESLTRMESLEVVTVTQGEDTKRGSASLLARQLRLRLVAAEGTTVPRHCTNITVSIHAIATFQALHDYLRPRVAGVGPAFGGSRLSGVLAAFAAAAGLTPGGTPSAGTPTGLPKPESPSSSLAEGPSTSGAAAGSSSTSPPKPQDNRRRSLRLSKKNTAAAPAAPPADAPPSEDAPVAPPAAGPSTTTDSPLPPEIMDHLPDAEDYIEDDFEPDVYDDELDVPTAAEKTVTLAVADDGAKVEAQTPDGTRVATPNPASQSGSSALLRASYASALKAKPTDWHLEFSMDDHVLPLDMTIYGAVHQQQARKAPSMPSVGNIWSGVYTIKFKKVPGPASLEATTSDPVPLERAASPVTTSVPDDAPHAKILRLLRVLHKLNLEGSERLTFDRAVRTLPDSAFVNNKLTAKLTRQLEEPMIVASSCLPDWALDLPQHYPFLFPFATRFSFLQSTSFGYARLILKWQSQQTRTNENSRRDDAFGYLGRLQRQKVRISRKFLLESAIKVLELYGSSSSVLEVEYFDEVGTGLGPTLEFYSLVSREFARRDIKMWHDSDATGPGLYVSHPLGLFPAPFSRSDIIQDALPSAGKKRSDLFRVLGQFVAKALLDSRIIDISFNKVFLKMILAQEVPLTLASLEMVDPTLANSMAKVQAYSSLKRDIEANVTLPPPAKKSALASLAIDGVKLEDLALDFTVPGYDIELREGGKDITVDATNVDEYVREVLDVMIGRGVQVQARAFREGFSKVFPVADLQIFSSDELSTVLGNAEEDWSTETLAESIKADHGFNVDSRAIHDLLDIMAAYDPQTRREYLQFITGSPKLPIGGFRGLNPPLTVVRKPHESPLCADDYLPSVMTCVNYLKLPEYSSKAVMREKLATAVKEGVGSFHLS